MGTPIFKIIKSCFQDTKEHSGKDSCFYLEYNDSWNDYLYYVTYSLHATKIITGKENRLIGVIKLMRVGQEKNERSVLENSLGHDSFDVLPDDFVSLSVDYDFYQNLKTFSLDNRKVLAENLHIITGRECEYYDMVKDDECFNTALLRDTSIDNFLIQKSKSVLFAEECKYDLRKQSFEFKYSNCDTPVKFSFSCFNDIESTLVPNGIIAFIGKNGAGKSTALYNLAKMLFLMPSDRPKLHDVCGQISPNDIGVERMIVISYSPFDNFTMPSTENHAIQNQGVPFQNQNCRYIYCGIRDLDVEHKKRQEQGIINDINWLKNLREMSSSPKDQDRLAGDFACAFKTLMDDKLDGVGRLLWANVANNARRSFGEIAELMEQFSDSQSLLENAQLFKKLSTGHKYFLHSMAYVIAYLVEGSLVLLDEPENHIHPPLLSFMMSQYREILYKLKSVMIVSTHSPVVIQELFASNVYKVYNARGKMIVERPSIETFGASYNEISTEVFGLNSDITKYFEAYDELFEKWHLGNADSIDKMLEDFHEKIGHQVSSQIESYYISKYFETHN